MGNIMPGRFSQFANPGFIMRWAARHLPLLGLQPLISHVHAATRFERMYEAMRLD
jgi:hypothetical protein